MKVLYLISALLIWATSLGLGMFLDHYCGIDSPKLYWNIGYFGGVLFTFTLILGYVKSRSKK